MSLTKRSASSSYWGTSKRKLHYSRQQLYLKCVNLSCKWGWVLSLLLNPCPHRKWLMAGIFEAGEIGRLTGISVIWGRVSEQMNDAWRWTSIVQHIELLVGHGKNWVGSSFFDSYRRDLVKYMWHDCVCNQKLDKGRTKGEGDMSDSELIRL